MRVWFQIATVLVLAAGAIQLGCYFTPDLPAGWQATETWRHTAHGWESARRWSQSPAPWPPLSPVVVASFQLLASILALLMFERRPPTLQRQIPEPHRIAGRTVSSSLASGSWDAP